jgi:hypothetical protein
MLLQILDLMALQLIFRLGGTRRKKLDSKIALTRELGSRRCTSIPPKLHISVKLNHIDNENINMLLLGRLIQRCPSSACLHYTIRYIRIREQIMVYFNANAANEMASGFPLKRSGRTHSLPLFLWT